jgi:hypothetical protein
MPDVPISNETTYQLAPWILGHITSEVIEYFGENIHLIRVQVGIHRHVFNTKTREVRYAFYPDDYGLSNPVTPSVKVNTDGPAMVRRRDYDNAFMPAELGDEPDEAETVLSVIGEDLDVFDPDADTEFQGLDPDFDAIDITDQPFLNEF